MTDLRKAAEELMPILERWKMTYPPCSGADWDKVESLRQALAQQGKECIYPECEIAGGCDGPCGSAVEQEPVAWMYVNYDGECEQIEYGEPFNDPSVTPLYTAPPSIEAAVLAEREACLKEIAIELDEWKHRTNANIALNNVYAAIQARSEK